MAQIFTVIKLEEESKDLLTTIKMKQLFDTEKVEKNQLDIF